MNLEFFHFTEVIWIELMKWVNEILFELLFENNEGLKI